MRSKFEDTRQKAMKYGANGATVKAYKPASDGTATSRIQAAVRLATGD